MIDRAAGDPAAGAVGVPKTPFPNSFWIEPACLLAGENPAAAAAADTAARLQALLGIGATYFIDLTQAGELPSYDQLLPPARADGRYVIYVRKAIPDHGLPESPAVMAEILDTIAQAIEVGHIVYVHCRAGIGRTNLVAGCWLRRRGHSGPAAIERLNRLWQSNARAKSWPRVPESDAQARYVVDWREPDDDSAGLSISMTTLGELRERYLGALLGLACGDAMGATVQCRRPGQFPKVADLLGGGHWQLPRGAWTDDTAMNLCLAESLLTHERFESADQLQRYRRWQHEGHLSSTGQCIGITAPVARALQEPAPAAGCTLDAQALTRTGVVALYAASSPATVFEWAVAAAGLTDPVPAPGAEAGDVSAPEAGEAAADCRAYAGLMLAAVRGASRRTVVADAESLWQAHGAIAAGRKPALVGAGGAVALVVDSLVHSNSFREGLLRIVNLGGDADIHGALFGQLAGAVLGAKAIPGSWRDALLRRELLEESADRLLAAALAPRA